MEVVFSGGKAVLVGRQLEPADAKDLAHRIGDDETVIEIDADILEAAVRKRLAEPVLQGEDLGVKKIEVGQIWKEVDPRYERYVIIVSAVLDPTRKSKTPFISIRTVVPVGSGWGIAPRSRVTHVAPARFNGKRGGYSFVKDAPIPGVQ